MHDRCNCCLAIALTWLINIDLVAPKEVATFEKDVRPIFKAYCLDCHGGGEALKGKLDLRLKRFAERGGESGPAIVAGKPEESFLLDRLKDGEMPPGEKKVPAEQIAVIERWIAGGAATLRPSPNASPGIDITPEERAYWAFQPVRRPAPPTFRTERSGPDADRRLRPGEASRARAFVRPRGRQADADPPRGVRPDGPATVAGSDRRVPGRLDAPTPTSG